MLKQAPMALQALTILAIAVSTLGVRSAAQVCIWHPQDSSSEGGVEGRYSGIWKCTALGKAASLPYHMMTAEDQDLLTRYAHADGAADFAKKNPNGTRSLSLVEAYELWYQFAVDYVHLWRKVLESPAQVVIVVSILYACVLMWGGFWDFHRVYFNRGDIYLGMLLILSNYMIILLWAQDPEAPDIQEGFYIA